MLRYALVAATLALPGAAQAKAFNVALNGFCNTFALTVSGFQIYGTRGGCGYTVIDGGTVGKVSTIKYYISNDTNDSQEIFTWYFTPPKGGHGNWYLYSSTATGQTAINSGTYGPAPAAARTGLSDVTRR